MPILIGAAMIAAAILLSTLITAMGTRFVGMESPTEETVWLVDRLTGSVYKCQAPERGKASCEAEIATGAIRSRSVEGCRSGRCDIKRFESPGCCRGFVQDDLSLATRRE